MDGESSSLANGDGDPFDVFNDVSTDGSLTPTGGSSGFSLSSIPWWAYAVVGGLLILKFTRR